MCCLLFSFLLLLLSFRIQDNCIRYVGFEMNSIHIPHSAGGSMYVNHIGVRMTRTKVRGGLNLSESGVYSI